MTPGAPTSTQVYQIGDTPRLGDRVRDRVTHIEGVLLCIQNWHDRTSEAAIQREGLNADGNAFDLHWCPLSRLTVQP